MKAWIISDMHVTHADMTAEIPQADICVCAGDLSGFLALGLEFLKRRIASTIPVAVKVESVEESTRVPAVLS